MSSAAAGAEAITRESRRNTVGEDVDAFAVAGVRVGLAFAPAVLLQLGLDPARVAQHQAVDGLVLASAAAQALGGGLLLRQLAEVRLLRGLLLLLGGGEG